MPAERRARLPAARPGLPAGRRGRRVAHTCSNRPSGAFQVQRVHVREATSIVAASNGVQDNRRAHVARSRCRDSCAASAAPRAPARCERRRRAVRAASSTATIAGYRPRLWPSATLIAIPRPWLRMPIACTPSAPILRHPIAAAGLHQREIAATLARHHLRDARSSRRPACAAPFRNPRRHRRSRAARTPCASDASGTA